MTQTEWDALVLKNSPGALFQSWRWGEVGKRLGHKIWRFAWPGAIAQVEKIPARRGTFLHVRHGPIVTGSWRKIVEDLRTLARDENAWFVRVSPQMEDSETNRKLLASFDMKSAAIHAMDAELCWMLDLSPSEEQLLANMRKTTRYEIRRAQKLGVVVEKSENPSDLQSFFTLYKETSERHDFVPHSGIEEEFKEFLKDKRTILLLGRHSGRVMGAAIILFYGHQAVYHHSASTPTQIPVNYAIQWEAIREAKKRGMSVYNFWGIAPEDKPNHPWRGITLFKKGFGGREVKFIHAHDLPVSPAYRLTRAIELVRKLFRGY